MHSSRSDSDIFSINFDNNINQSELACWGLDNSGQSLVPANASGAVYVSTGAWHTCIIGQFGQLVCWGINIQY